MTLSVSNVNPVVRAVLVIGSIAALVSGITFAALSSTATLTNNTISSGTAALQIASYNPAVPETETPASCGTFGAEAPGFAFTGVVPGGSATEDKTFCLRNDGTTTLSLAVALDVAPVWTTVPAGSPVNNEKVNVEFACTAGAVTFGASTTVAALVSGPVSLTAGSLAADTEATCDVNVSMLGDAFSGSSVSSSEFDFVFTGTAV